MQAAGTVADRFDWRTFRRWRLSHAGFRSFSVLRHPLARAHDGFCRRILTAEMSEIRRALIRSYRIPLPDAGTRWTSTRIARHFWRS